MKVLDEVLSTSKIDKLFSEFSSQKMINHFESKGYKVILYDKEVVIVNHYIMVTISIEFDRYSSRKYLLLAVDNSNRDRRGYVPTKCICFTSDVNYIYNILRAL